METKELFELTNPQKNIWNTELYFSDTNVNNLCVSAILNEVVNFDVLKKAINILVQKNDSFRINLSVVNDTPMQFFCAFKPFDIDVIDVNSESEFASIENDMVNEKFTLFDSNLFTFKIAKFSDGRAGVILNVHHIIADSWSLGLTIQEIVKIYHCLIKGDTNYVSNTFSYKNLILSEKEYKNSNRYKSDKDFWNDYLNDFSEPVSIPSIKKGTYANTSKAKRLSFNLDRELVKQISDYCEKYKISNYAFFMSIFSLYIANISNVNDLIIGTPILNRLNYKDKLTTGMFVTTKPFRTKIENNISFTDFAINNNINLISLFRHQKFPYSEILDNIRKSEYISNLYNIALSYQITKAYSDEIGDYNSNWTFNGNCLDEMNIHLYDINDSGNLIVNYDFLLSKYSEDEIILTHERILNIISQILSDNNISINEIEIITASEKNKIISNFNNRILECPFDKNIINIFEDQVQKYPNNLALLYKDEQYTYKELNSIVNKLARYLAEKNVQKNDIVGVCMNKNSWFIISILAIQKLGAAYLPMHPDYPEDRINYILSDSNSKLLITDQSISSSITVLKNPNKLKLSEYDDSNLNINFTSDNLCYVIYTSGSTGKPKGVMLTHYNLINFVYNLNDCFNNKFSPADNCLSVANIAFDASVQEIFTPLCFGATLVLYPKNTLTNIPLLCDILEKNHITFSFLPPNILEDIFNFIYKNKTAFEINKLSVGVEAIKNSTLNNFYKLNKNIEIVNGYGPSEATICSTFFVYKYDKSNNIVPIGYPLKNNKIFILNRFNKLQPVGMPGELCITGKNVSLGYLNNNDLTHKSFISLPNFSNSKIYKTGDICYWMENGCINFIGRKDSQIKFRGHRIELSEIANCVKNIDEVSNAYTLLMDINNVPSLCLYVVSNNKKITSEYIHDYLTNKLAFYMIPTHIIILKKFPLTKSGKIDKRALPKDFYNTTNIVKPLSKTEKELHDMICELLNLQSISVTDNYLDLGMDSLLSIRFSLKIYDLYKKNITVTDLFKYNTISSLANHLNNLNNSENFLEIEKHPFKVNYELSSAQKRIYYASKASKNNSLLYNVSGGLLFTGLLNIDKVNNIFNTLIKKHSSFRTYFKIENNVPMQFVDENVTINVNAYNHDKMSENDLQDLVDNFPKAFDLDFAPLLRVELHYFDNSSILLVDSHHIIMDGTSLSLLIKEFCDLYNNENKVYENTIDYTDFSITENEFISSNKIIPIKNYWYKRYSDFEIPVINLPYDFSKSEIKTYNGKKLYFKFSKSLFENLGKLSNKLDISNYMIFLASLYLLLYKYSGQENLIIGSPIESRNNSKLNNIIGNFVNNIALNLNINPELTVKNFILEVKNSVLDALSNQPYPYDLLIKDLKIPSNSSLFDVVLAYQNEMDYTKIRVNDDKVEMLLADTKTSKFDLTFEVVPSTFNINIEYNSDLFKKETIESLYDHFIYILETISKKLTTKIKNFDIITEKENMLLSEFNNTEETINDDTVMTLFEEQARLNPDNIALICDDKKLTYDELNKKSNSLAHLLIENGVKPNDIVCIMTNRSLETIVCMLGILKAGAAFLNVDPTYPIERTQYYLSDCKAQYVLTQRSLKDTVKQIKNCIEIDLDNEFYNYNLENPYVIVQPTDLSYVIYTSGSTGTPKGVMLNQIGFINMAKAMTKVLDYLKEGNKHCLVSVTSTPFDIFVYEIIVSLTHGLKVLLANNAEHRNPLLLDALIKKYGGDVMTVTPSLMKINYDNRLSPSALSNIKHMVFGGEPLSEKFVQDLRELSKDVTIYNIYGPSEITILSNVQNLNGQDKITIGPPIMNTQIHILDKNGNRVPIGVVGEIYISGIQVGSGYIGKPEMTRQKFLTNKFGSGKMYKSGDIGRWTFDGKVQCLGRVDNQIKLRGLRIELGEIEGKMETINGVISSVVNKFEFNGKEVLCGYYVTDKNSDITEQFVKDFLRKNLPYYMIPTYIVHLNEMPYTINRKIDRKALPKPDFSNLFKNSSTEEILTIEEEQLLNIWKKILNLENISINDNFFDIGGDSISAINMQLEAMKSGFNFEYSDIFNYPTIKSLSSTDNKKTYQEHSISDYDYTTINNVLNKNDISNISTIKDFDVKNILLIGGTGYLGSHIINSFIKNEKGIVYCLVRAKNNVIPSERLKNILNFYFGDGYYEKNSNRIHIIEGDIVKENLGITSKDLNLLKNNISTIINSGALVKHFGQKDIFEKINVLGTKNVVELCKNLNKRLMHISTISVSGNGEKENSIQETSENINSKKIFSEKDLFVGQNLEGVYSTTKFKAEQNIFEEISNNNLNAQVLRIGNIVNRYSDGVFQRNTRENAFAQRIRSFIKIGVFPEYSLQHELEVTPVDLCSDAIIKLLQHDSVCNTFHIYNTKLMSIMLFYETLRDLGYDISPVSDDLMSNIITDFLENPEKKDSISGIIQDLDSNKHLLYTSNIKLESNFTELYLKELGFEWKTIDKNFIMKYINYFRKIKFLD